MKIVDHRDLIASIDDEQRRELTQKSNTAGLRHLIGHFGAIFLVSALIWFRVPGWQALLVVLGILLIFLFTLLHECIHRTPFASDWLNDGVAQICGFLVGVQPLWFRYFHLAHHRHTQDPDHDPELASPKPETVFSYCLHVSGIPVWWSFLKTLFRHAFVGCTCSYVPNSARTRVVREARIYLLFYVLLVVGCISLQSLGLLFHWVIPVVLGQPFLRLYLLAEHGRCPMVANMLENTRTTFTNRIVRRLAWNMPFHAEHHAYPTVPFHKLPRLHELSRKYLKQTENGYLRFNRSFVSDLKPPRPLEK